MSGPMLLVPLLVFGAEPLPTANPGHTPPIIIPHASSGEGSTANGSQGGRLATLFSTDDYPDEAIRNAESGTVSVMVVVGADGLPGECIVTESSRSASLDAATCNVIKGRARFQPARDRKGRPIQDTVTARIRWVLPEGGALALDQMMRTWIRFDAEGDAEACGLAGRSDARTFPECGPIREYVSVAWSLAGDERPLANVTLAQTFDRRLVAQPGRVLPGAEEAYVVARQVVEVDLDSSGHVTACRVLVSKGTRPGTQACSMMAKAWFQPDLVAKLRHVQSIFTLTATPSN